MKKVRYITDAAMVTSILAVFLLISHLSGGIIVTNFYFLLPIPITIYGLKYNCKKAVIPALASIFIALIINWIIGLLYVFPLTIAGITYVFALKNFKQKPGLRFSVMFVGSLIVNILTTVFFSRLLFGFTIVEDTINFANSIMDLLKSLNISLKYGDYFLQSILICVIPAIIVISSLMESFVAYLIISIMANKVLKMDLGAGIITFNMKVPRMVTCILLPISLISLFFIDVIVNEQIAGFYLVLEAIGINVLVLLSLAYLIIGLFISCRYISKKNAQYLLVLVLVVLFCVPYLYVIIGFIDSLFNIRKKLI